MKNTEIEIEKGRKVTNGEWSDQKYIKRKSGTDKSVANLVFSMCVQITRLYTSDCVQYIHQSPILRTGDTPMCSHLLLWRADASKYHKVEARKSTWLDSGKYDGLG